jgi:hypothetical protein
MRFRDAKNVELNHSNMMNESSHELKKTSAKSFMKTSSSPERIIKLDDGGDNIISELKGSSSLKKLPGTNSAQSDPSTDDHFDIIDIVMRKFNSNTITTTTHKTMA